MGVRIARAIRIIGNGPARGQPGPEEILAAPEESVIGGPD